MGLWRHQHTIAGRFFCGLESARVSKEATGKQELAGEFYIPTHRGETAMDEAPELFGLVGENKQLQLQTLRRWLRCVGLG